MAHDSTVDSHSPRTALSPPARSMSPRVPTAAFVALALLVFWQLLPAATVAYDIVYVRMPRAGDDKQVKFADVFGPLHVEAGSDLMLLHPDGKEEVLVPGGKGAVTDPCVSFDAQWVYYSFIADPGPLSPFTNTPVAGADIYKINLQSRQVVRLTNQEYTPNTSVRNDAPPYGIYNMGPCPVAGGKVVFTSNRNGFIPPKQYTPVTSQLYVMDEDGSNVRAIAPMTLGAALHPFQLKDGRIAFSSQEAQGLRDNRVWALWAIWPDGRHWEPLMSAFSTGSVLHFATQLSNTDLIIEDYYNANNMGFGTFYRFPSQVPAGTPGFNSLVRAQNPPVDYTDPSGARRQMRFSFSPVGLEAFTPFSTMFDEGAGLTAAGGTDRLGKVMHPSAAPNNDLLLVWSPGPVNLLPRPVTTPAPDAGLYIARGGAPVQRPSDLVLIKNDPRYNEIWPRAVVPYRAIHGVDEPFNFPFLPNDGSANPALPEGTPYGIIGTSSFYKRDSFPGFSTLGSAYYDGLDAFNNPADDQNPNWKNQGADDGKYTNDQIAAVRILMMEPQTDMSGAGGPKFFNHVNERLRILGEIPLRKTGSDGAPVVDAEGNPDTSFWAKVPADTPISFQMLDGAGRVLTMAQTWHQVRPGEVRVDCGGCHAHSQVPLAFEGTAASKSPPTDLTLQPAHDVEFIRDIRPILQRSCVSCHKGDPATAPGQLSLDDRSDVAGAYPDSTDIRTPTDYARLARDKAARWGTKPPQGAYQYWAGANGSRYARVFQSRRSLLAWKLAGERTDGWTNAQWESNAPFTQDISRYVWDIDFDRGSVDHAKLLTDAEKRLFYAWIDLAMPVDLGGGYWRDENRPTLTVRISNGTILVGAADGYSGLDEASLSLQINGSAVPLSSRGGGIWSAPAPSGAATIVARVKDRAGNWNELKLSPSRAKTTSTSSRDLMPASPLATVTPDQSSGAAAVASTTADGVRLLTQAVVSALDTPQSVVFAPDGRMFVGEASGAVRIVDLSHRVSTLALPPASPDGDVAVLDLALDPDFARNGMVYVYRRTAAADGSAVDSVDRYREAGGYLGQRAVLIDGIPAGDTGGRVAFGPDRMLYITTADLRSPSLAQDLGSLAGKMLRLSPDGATPRDNPFASPIYSYGQRGPTAFDWHPVTGELWAAEAGTDGGASLRLVGRGANEGWPPLVGTAATMRSASASATAAVVPAASFYRSPRFPQFANDLFVTGANGTTVARVRIAADSKSVLATEFLRTSEGLFRDVAAGPDGYLYLALDGNPDAAGVRTGRILRVMPSS